MILDIQLWTIDKFGGLNNLIIGAGFDVAEILVLDHFRQKDKVIDLAGENCLSPYDGICPNGQRYDVKNFVLDNSEKDKIDWFYLLAFNEDYSEILHVWRIPTWDFMMYLEKGRFWVCMDLIDKMKRYEITERFIPVFENWLNNIK